MSAYIPSIYCAKCQKQLPYGASTVMRINSENERYIRVRCHGEEMNIAFSDKPGQQVTLWQNESRS